jgi:hypothetical protein
VIDHIVYATPDLEATVTDLGSRTGIELTPGGRHVGHGTRNYLAGLGDGAYLEVIGPDLEQPPAESPWPFGVDTLDAPVLVAWAVRVNDMDAALRAARTNGWDPGSAAAMGRLRPDGVQLTWMLTPWTSPHPFLIDWGRTPHPSESAPPGLRLVTLTVPVLPAFVTSDQRLVEGEQLGATIETPRGPLEL